MSSQDRERERKCQAGLRLPEWQTIIPLFSVPRLWVTTVIQELRTPLPLRRWLSAALYNKHTRCNGTQMTRLLHHERERERERERESEREKKIMSFNFNFSLSLNALTSLSPSASMDNSASGQKREKERERERERENTRRWRRRGEEVNKCVVLCCVMTERILLPPLPQNDLQGCP